MLFGSKEYFAIEACNEPGLEPPGTMWSRMCFWSEGVMIGDLEEPYCTLGGTADGLRDVIQTMGSLWLDEFDGLTDEEIFHRFDHGLYLGDIDRSWEAIKRDGDLYWKFNFLTNWEEQYDGLKGFLAHHPSGEMVMIIRQSDGSLICRRIDPDLFVWVASAFIDWFDRESARWR